MMTLNKIQPTSNCLKMLLDVINEMSPKDQQRSISPGLIERNVIINMAFKLGYKYGEEKKAPFLVSAEIRKQMDGYNIYPDFVIHENHDETDKTRKKQHLILEAKTTKRLSLKSFIEDLKKLYFYANVLNFEDSVFLIYGIKEDKINQMLCNKTNVFTNWSLDVYSHIKIVLIREENNKFKPYLYKLSGDK